MSLEAIIAQVDKKFGKGTMCRASDAQAIKLIRIPLRIPQVDLALGGGIPKARITLFKGAFSTGKSLMGLFAAREFQRRCRFCDEPMVIVHPLTGEEMDGTCKCKNPMPMQIVWLDIEGTFDKDWAEKQEVDLSNLHLIRPETAEMGIDVADLVIKSGEADLVVVDSIAAMTPKTEIKESMEDWQMGLQARLVNKAMRKFTSSLNAGDLHSNVGRPAIIMINQVRVNLGVTFGSKETTPGGKGQEFHSSIIGKMARTKNLTVDTDKKDPFKPNAKLKKIVGARIGISVPKNKTAAPHKSGTFDFYFSDCPEEGMAAGEVDMAEQFFSLGLTSGAITKGGAWYKLADGDSLGQGETKAKAALVEHPELCEQIWQDVAMKELGYVP